MIHIRNAHLSYGDQILFNDVSLAFLQDQRIGVLGRNGTGKSTLLKIIAGEAQLDEGTVDCDRHKKVGYMPQEVVLLSSKNVLEEALSVSEVYTVGEQEKKSLESRLEGEADAETVERYAAVHEQFTAYDAALALERTERVLTGLGFTRKMFEQPVAELSVGWKMRLVLAKLLLEDADFYLFDEPTNHLDLPTKQWFFDFLKQGTFGFLMVSHDRHYLDRACDYILALERSKAHFFRGNLSAYLKEAEQQQRVLETAYHRQQKEITRKEATIERFRAKSSKAKMAKSMERQLGKMERIEIEPIMPTLKVRFPQAVRPGSVVLTLSEVEHAFESNALFKDVTGTLARGERVALVAPNGTGKTTLFNLIAGKYQLQQGDISCGHNVNYAVFEQDQMRALNPKNTVLEEILMAIGDVSESAIRTLLGSFLFRGETIFKKIAVLSGGERNRVAMVKVLLAKANLLLLDEPTNHLDLYAKEVLLQALLQYEGTILFVSHDHSFLESLATRIWELTPQGLNDYPGTYESFLEYKKSQIEVPGQTSKAQGGDGHLQDITPTGKESHMLRKEVRALETKIARLERDIEVINQSFVKLEYGSDEYDLAAQKLKAAKQRLGELMVQWESLMSGTAV